MRILHIITQKPGATGSGTYLTGLMRSFDNKGVDQYLIFGMNKGDREYLPLFSGRFHSEGVVFNGGDLEFPVTGMSDVMPYRNTRYMDLTEGDRKKLKETFIVKVRRALEEFSPDLIICQHLYLITSHIAEELKKSGCSTPIIGISHGTDIRQLKNISETREEILRGLLNLDRILFLHENQIGDFRELAKTVNIEELPEERMAVIGSGFDSYIFNTALRTQRLKEDASLLDKSSLRIIFTGKVSRAKGFVELLDALKILSERLPVELTVIGSSSSPEEFSQIREKASSMPYAVNFLGLLPYQEDLVKEYSKNHLFILPSYYEGLPLVVPESMATGIKALVTELPGIRNWLGDFKEHIEFIPMPKMQNIDTPTEEGRVEFIKNIAESILRLHERADYSALPDMSSMNWDALSERILSLYKSFQKNIIIEQ